LSLRRTFPIPTPEERSWLIAILICGVCAVYRKPTQPGHPTSKPTSCVFGVLNHFRHHQNEHSISTNPERKTPRHHSFLPRRQFSIPSFSCPQCGQYLEADALGTRTPTLLSVTDLTDLGTFKPRWVFTINAELMSCKSSRRGRNLDAILLRSGEVSRFQVHISPAKPRESVSLWYLESWRVRLCGTLIVLSMGSPGTEGWTLFKCL